MSSASWRSRSRRSALRTSAGPNARYAACGSPAASTLDADVDTGRVVQALERAVVVVRARPAIDVALPALHAIALRALAVVIARARIAVQRVVQVGPAQPRREREERARPGRLA